MIEQPTRRGLILGLSALIAAPAIVRASSLMPIKTIEEPWTWVQGDVELTFSESLLEIARAIFYDTERTFFSDYGPNFINLNFDTLKVMLSSDKGRDAALQFETFTIEVPK